MADTGAPFELPYPTPSDLVRDGADAIKDLAEQVESYLLYTESRTVTASATLALTDTSKVVAVNSAGATTITVPANATVAFPVGALVGVFNLGAGTATVEGAGGVTVRNEGDVLQYQEVSLRKRGTDEWVMV
jgi:hypothetical protein